MKMVLLVWTLMLPTMTMNDDNFLSSSIILHPNEVEYCCWLCKCRVESVQPLSAALMERLWSFEVVVAVAVVVAVVHAVPSSLVASCAAG